MMRAAFLLLMLLSLPAAAIAQDARTGGQEERTPRHVATTGYTLALSWTPEYCHGHRDGAECGLPGAKSFTLHGLWPDGADARRWPQYCRTTSPLAAADIRIGEAVTPSSRLLQHEWDKHGSCMAADPAAYFREEQRLYRTVRFPDMTTLSRRRDLTVGMFQDAFVAANPGMTPGMVRTHLNARGWLEELRLCLGLDKRPRRCPADATAPTSETRMRVQAPG